jgi:peroxiredoxin
MAPRLNELFREIQKRPAWRENIRVIGIGVGNSPFEVKSFKEKYQVPFPLFSDQSMNACRALGVEATPTFIGIKGDEKGLRE